MAALRFSFLAILFLCSCAHSQAPKNIVIESQVGGCFSFNTLDFEKNKEPLLLTASINSKTETGECPCKSALMKYTAYQKKDGNIFNLLSGQFSVLGKEKIVLPIAVQKQLVFKDAPIYVSLSCSSN